MSADIPSDEELLKEIQAKIMVLSTPHNVAKYGKPDIQTLIAERRQWYADKPKRAAAAAKYEAERKKEAEKAERQYRRELKKQGKPIIKQDELIVQYPTVAFLKERKLTQPELQRYAEMLSALGAASELYKEGQAIEQQYLVPGRKKMAELVAKAYGLYRRVEASTLKEEIYDEMANILKSHFGIGVHVDTPNATLLLKMVFPSMKSKAAHQYGRALDFALSYEVTADDYVAFIKEHGGYEKIRRAYAKVLAADAGKLLPLQKQAAEVATLEFMSGLEPVVKVQLTAPEGRQLRKYQSAQGYHYLIADIDMHNNMEILCAIPPGNGWEDNLMKHIEQAAQSHPDWQEAYERLYGLLVKRSISKTVEKVAKAEEKAKYRAKRAEGQKKRDAAFKREVERERKKAGAKKT
ncbi:hypothetical protein [Fluviibacter phosphoraccumulans]|uniref:Uncharacterized protein n=1 Tax=Fluviibacter phosphoraccumulans TaxID=1751046 RepID=A0A679I6W9_9RHOO|nr:hypothetical protein [Fluviibacter phosphoraccumulans]BBU68546.1 hypothetical protein ICHIAU1_08290 [Fluviibacter phosphoraccumulans]BBU72299.1 hypothetical protein ICHIJ1_22180 [Fluviibacter phosphoraccumulans]BCA64459.1 hypothetical protein SHINM1_000610 [Fluviibacter phosphoraccumulans]